MQCSSLLKQKKWHDKVSYKQELKMLKKINKKHRLMKKLLRKKAMFDISYTAIDYNK